MATYKISDLLKQLHDLQSAGYEYTDIFECDEDDDYPAALSFEAIVDNFSGESFGEVESVSLPDNYIFNSGPRRIIPDDPCLEILFTYNELTTVHHAASCALEYCKDCLKDPSNSKDTIAEIKSDSINLRNLKARLEHFFSRIK